MSYRHLEHSTDAFIEVKAKTLEEAFSVAGKSVVETIIDLKNIQEIEEKNINVKGRNLLNLLYNWLEEIVTITITDGFAIKNFSVNIKKNDGYEIISKISGEKLDLKKHNFKILCRKLRKSGWSTLKSAVSKTLSRPNNMPKK